MPLMTYYISNNGDDLNDGLTPNTSWATIKKVNACIKSGDTIRLKCGDTFYGRINLPPGISEQSPTVIKAYGEGAKPKLSQYKIANNADSWIEHNPNVWKLDLTDTTKYSGNITDIDTNVGFINISGAIFGAKKFTMDNLSELWDFYNDEQYVYVFANVNPTLLVSDIKIACDIMCIDFVDYLHIFDLEIVGSGGHGLRGSLTGGRVCNCDMHELGGSELLSFPTPNIRYGNGIEVWVDSSDIIVENNRIYDVYDVAFTMQGNDVKKGWDNIVFKNNIVWNNQQSFEIWSEGGLPNTGFSNCVFENNICMNAGFGWSYDVRPDKKSAVHLLMYQLYCPKTDITIRNNVFYNPREGIYFKSINGESNKIPDDYNSDYNYIILNQEQKICVGIMEYPVEEHIEFSKTTGKDRNSEFYIIKQRDKAISDLIVELQILINEN